MREIFEKEQTQMSVTVSVIMGIYNVADTLSEALESLINQTFQDFEVILCDDGSVDDTLAIAKLYHDRYPYKIRVFKNSKNMGLNYTLNYCLKQVRGKYVARMDGDDVCDPTRFEKQVNFLDENPEYAIVGTPMILFDENGIFGITKTIEYPQKRDFIYGNPFHHATAMIRTEAYKSVNGYTVDKKMLRVEDVDLWFKLFAAGYRGHNIQEPLYMMRDDLEASSRRKFRYRMNAAYASLVGFKRIRMPLIYYPIILRSIVVGLIPNKIRANMRKKKYRRNIDYSNC